jgi:hypothetical protein
MPRVLIFAAHQWLPNAFAIVIRGPNVFEMFSKVGIFYIFIPKFTNLSLQIEKHFPPKNVASFLDK